MMQSQKEREQQLAKRAKDLYFECARRGDIASMHLLGVNAHNAGDAQAARGWLLMAAALNYQKTGVT